MCEMSKKASYLLVALLVLFPLMSFSASQYTLPPRLFLWGNLGSRIFGEADGIFPLWGNHHRFFFTSFTAKYGNDNAGLGSLGLGTRSWLAEKGIVGAYVFADYNKTSRSNYFLIANPGIEWLSSIWDVHTNAYLPLGKKSKTINTFRTENTSFFVGHSQYDMLFKFEEVVGAGADIEIGHRFPNLYNLRILGGAYVFTPPYCASIQGIGAGFDIPLKSQALQIGFRDTYDNAKHNTFLFSLRLTFDGLKPEGNNSNRMLQDIPRHFGSLNSGNGIPSRTHITSAGKSILVQDNIWFFNPGDSLSSVQNLNNCTFERPCFGLGQSQIDAIQGLSPGANFYLSSGNYSNLGEAFHFYNGQNVFGRIKGFRQLAKGDSRPILEDSVFLNGNNNLFNLRVQGHSVVNLNTSGVMEVFQVGILTTSDAIGNNNIFNSEIKSTSTINNVIGVANNSHLASLNIYNTVMRSELSNFPAGISVGAANLRSGGLNLLNSLIYATTSDVTDNYSQTLGLMNNEAGTIHVANSVISAYLNHGGLLAGVINNASVAGGLGQITLRSSLVMAYGNDVMQAGGVINQANNMAGESGTVFITQSAVSVTSMDNGGGTAGGIVTTGSGVVSISHSLVNGTGDSGTIAGLIVEPSGILNYADLIISWFTSGTASGVSTINNGTLQDWGGSQYYDNGL